MSSSLPETLTELQFGSVTNLMSLAIACLGAAAIYLFTAPRVGPRQKPAMMVSGLVCAIATYHYFRISNSWEHAYALDIPSGVYHITGIPFNGFYRYADWIITVPLLMIELIAVLTLPAAKARPLFVKLAVAAFFMIGLGYPGEVGTSPAVIWTFFVLSMLPFLYILYVLFVELGESLAQQPAAARGLIGTARIFTLVLWSFYPIAFVVGKSAAGNAAAEVFLQAGYTVADIGAKAGFGLLIYFIARVHSAAELDNGGKPVVGH
jgi:bacteriorhodopsin